MRRLVIRNEHGWKIKTRFLIFHPVSYGTGTLARVSVGWRVEGWRLLLHYFPKQGFARTFHDHPWSFWTFVVWGSYLDQAVQSDGSSRYERMTPGTLRFRPARHRHKTAIPKRCFTVVVARPTERDWCEGDATEWVCGGVPADFNETLGHIRR